MGTAAKLLMAFIAISIIFVPATAANFPDDTKVRNLNLVWNGGGANETMTAWIIKNYPIEEYGSVMIKVPTTKERMHGCHSPSIYSAGKSWQSYIVQKITGSIPNI